MGTHQTQKLLYCKRIKEVKRKPTEWEEIFTGDTLDRALTSRIYRLPQKTKKTSDSLKRWSKELNRDFTSEEVKMPGNMLKSVQHH